MIKDLDFPVTEKYNKSDIKKLQDVLLKMAKSVHSVLEKHNIKYCICLGTLLGAVRHEGYIPWDDDFDIYIFDEDYDKAMDILRKELPKWMIVHDEKVDPIYWPAWSRLRDINSIAVADLFPDDNSYKYRGINLDFYRLKKTSRSNVDIHIWNENLRFYHKKYSVGMLQEEVYRKKVEELENLIKSEKEKKVTVDDEQVFTFLDFMRKVEIKDMLPLKKYMFEEFEFWGPNNADAVLRESYGDYMEIPKYEERHPHYSSVTYIDSEFGYEI